MDDVHLTPWETREICQELCDKEIRRVLRQLSSDEPAIDITEEEIDKFRHSQYYRVCEHLVGVAFDKYPEDHDAATVEAKYSLSFLRDFLWAKTGRSDKDLRLWSHDRRIVDNIVNWPSKGIPALAYEDPASITDKYLSLPVRHRDVDRMLVDLLLAQECAAFGSKLAPFNKWLSAIYYISVDSFLSGIATYAILAIMHADGLVISVVTFLIFISFVGRIRYHFFGNQKRLSNLLDMMINCYIEVGSDSGISARHVLRRLESTSDHGAMWPSAVYVLLDDVERRGGTI